MLTKNITADDLNRGYPFDFNSIYKGYYASCRFTDLTYVLGAYRLAGTDVKGIPHLFTSFTGEAWEETSIVMNTPYGIRYDPKTPIVKILGEEQERQLYLICEGGEIVILPDCPKCVRIKEIPIPKGVKVISADFSDNKIQKMKCEDKVIRLRLSSGADIRMDLGELRQFRVAVSFAKQLILKGAAVIDVRDENEYTGECAMNFTGILHIPLDDLSEYLRKIPKEKVMLFLCRTGRKADFAAEYARKNGFHKAYSIGGIEHWAHTE